jgi:hypothetical protein
MQLCSRCVTVSYPFTTATTACGRGADPREEGAAVFGGLKTRTDLAADVIPCFVRINEHSRDRASEPESCPGRSIPPAGPRKPSKVSRAKQGLASQVRHSRRPYKVARGIPNISSIICANIVRSCLIRLASLICVLFGKWEFTDSCLALPPTRRRLPVSAPKLRDCGREIDL